MVRNTDYNRFLVHVPWVMAAVLGLAVILVSTTAVAQDDGNEKKFGWFFTAELAAVWTAGNSETNTLGLGATARRVWERSELKFELGGAQTESSIKTRMAVGSSIDNFVVEEDTRTEKTVELFYARGRYDYKVSKYFLVFGGTDWMRNKFSGIESRFLVAAGAGNTWLDQERMRFKTDYGVTYTFEEAVVDNPFIKSDFAGFRFGYTYWMRLTETAEFRSVLVGDLNLDNTDDLRLDLKNELPISISDRLKLKPALQLLWRNLPAQTELALFTSGGTPTGDNVFVPLEDLDTLFTLSLVFEM